MWYSLAVGILAVYRAEVAPITDVLQVILGPLAIVHTSLPSVDFKVGFAVGWNDTQVVVLIAGTRTWGQMFRNILGSSVIPFPAGGFLFSPSMLAFGVDLQSRLSAIGVPLDRPIVFAGHSLGGVLAHYLVARERQLRPSRQAVSITFGAPKGGDQSFADLVKPVTVDIRTSTDPVPFLPPRVDILSAFGYTIPLAYISPWGMYRKVSQGWRINVDSTIRADDEADVRNRDIVNIGVSLFLSVFYNEPDGHLIETYAELLREVLRNGPDIPPCTLDPSLIDLVMDVFDLNPDTVQFRIGTIDVYRVGVAPPAAPSVPAVPILIYANFWIRGEAGEGDAAVGHFTHVILVEYPFADIRDDYNEGTRGANYDTVYFPDKTGNGLVVRFVEYVAVGDPPVVYQRVYLDRKVPVWPNLHV